MTQDVTVEATAPEADNDVTVEEVQKQEPEVIDEVEDESQETESQEDGEGEEEQKPKTVEERLAEIESKYEEKSREAEAKQAKIDRQTAAYNKAQEALARQRQEYEAKLNQSQAVDDAEPNIDSFDTHEDYVNALSDWKAEKKVQEKELEFQQRQQQEKVQKIAEERAKIAQDQEAEYLKINPRYKASKGEFEAFISTANVSPDVENAVVSMAYKGNVPQLVDYFGSNNGEKIGELENIVSMSPIDAAIEIYKIQQKLVTPKKEEKKPLAKPIKAAPATKQMKDLSSGDVLKNLGLK